LQELLSYTVWWHWSYYCHKHAVKL